jgi:hypothetical protein
VLVNFWTYTCINWLRQLPYVRAWAATYSGQGLVVVGVHTPEFGFERDVDNISRAVRERGIDYPVAIDSDYAVWSAFDNDYWPALYFADSGGLIRHRHFGEGEYGSSEINFQELLAEAGPAGTGRELVSVDARGVEAPADWATLQSPENYTGYERTENFASPGGALYQLVRQPGRIIDSTVVITFLDPAVRAYAFTFGQFGTRVLPIGLGRYGEKACARK